MESWILFSLLTALFWSFSNIIDKFIFTRWKVSPVVPVMFSGLISMIIVVGIYLFRGLPVLSMANSALSFFAAFFYLLGYLFYFRAVKLEEASRITPLFYILPLFILLLAAIFFQERFTLPKYAGILFLVSGAVLITQKGSFSLRFGRAFWFMIFSAFSISTNAVITKYLLNFADYWTVFSYTRGLGLLPFLIPLIYIKLSDLKNAAKQEKGIAVGAVLGSISLNSAGVILITVAMAAGSVTLVNSLVSLQPLFVFIFALFISRFYPQIFKEDLNHSTVILKLVSILLIVAGAILIT